MVASAVKQVLIVDKSPVDGQMTKTILERLGSGYTCEVVTTHMAAVERLTKRPYELILLETDIQGHLDGLKLAQLVLMREKSRTNASTPVIVLVSGRRDRETILQIAALGLTAFIAKPYYPRAFLERIEAMTQARQTMADEEFTHTLLETLRGITHIPALPTVFAQVQALLSAPEPSIDEVSRAIETDPAITMRVLRLANSAYFGFAQTVKTIKHAISLLGFRTVQNTVVAISTFEALGHGTESAGLDKTGLWQHAVGCGEMATCLTRKLHLPEGDAFVGGLLHDVGKIVLDTFFAEFYPAVLDTVRLRDMPLVEAEQAVLGLTHAEVGAQLATMWDLPAELTTIIRWHHHPLTVDVDTRTMVALVHIADALCRQLGVGQPGDGTIPVLDTAVLESVKLRPDDLEGWLPELKEQAEKAATFLSATTGA